MVKFSRRWNGDGWFSPTMEWRWFLKILTITNHWWNGTCSTIGSDGFSMVFPILRTNGSRWLRVFHKKMKFVTKCALMKIYLKPKMAWNLQQSTTSTQVDINQGTSCSRHCKKIFSIFQKLSLVCLISASARHKGRKFSTIAKNQWFLRWPLPLMEWYLLNHWDQWFFNGFQSANHW